MSLTHSLARLLRPVETDMLAPVASEESSPEWLRAGEWRLFASPARSAATRELGAFRLEDGRTLYGGSEGNGRIVLPFDLDEAYANYVSETWKAASPNRRLSEESLATFYRVKRFIPRGAQLAARRMLTRWQGRPEFPSWPLDTSVSRLLRLYAACLLHASGAEELSFRWFWPAGHRAAVILTHDVESDEGIRKAVELADLEEELGFRSSFNFGRWYDVDPGVLRDLRDRGFEIGMHGLVHDRSLFSSRETFEEQLPGLRALAESLGAVGFRSPATHRVFDWLAELPVEYDCTIPNSDPYEPLPGGCCSVWPFFVGPVVELPYTLPQDHTLLTLLGHRNPALWLEQSAHIEAQFGLVQCVSHPDPGYLADPDKRAIYREYLRGMAERPHVWRALPRDVAAWWRRRDTADDGPVGRACAAADPSEVTIEPPLPVRP